MFKHIKFKHIDAEHVDLCYSMLVSNYKLSIRKCSQNEKKCSKNRSISFQISVEPFSKKSNNDCLDICCEMKKTYSSLVQNSRII